MSSISRYKNSDAAQCPYCPYCPYLIVLQEMGWCPCYITNNGLVVKSVFAHLVEVLHVLK